MKGFLILCVVTIAALSTHHAILAVSASDARPVPYLVKDISTTVTPVSSNCGTNPVIGQLGGFVDLMRLSTPSTGRELWRFDVDTGSFPQQRERR